MLESLPIGSLPSGAGEVLIVFVGISEVTEFQGGLEGCFGARVKVVSIPNFG